MNQEILDIFYNEILQEISRSNEVSIDGWTFNVNLSTSENNNVMLDIKNKNQFNETLVKYTKTMLNLIMNTDELKNVDYIFFEGDNHNIIKGILSSLWYNATEEDFRNPISFINARTKFIDDEISNNNLNNVFVTKNINKLKNLKISNKIETCNPSSHETPFVFKSNIIDDYDNEYNLPDIYYGIADNKCYIYSIQKASTKDDSFSKKVNRLLYKANKDVYDSYYDENIKDVSPSQLFSITTFIKFLNDNNIDEIIVKNNLPIRYLAKEMATEKRIKRLQSKIENKKEIEEQINNLLDENKRIYENIVNKYLRIFRRIEYHLSNVKVTSYPYDLDNNMHLKIEKNNNYNNSDHILNDIYNNADFIQNIKNK